ncbi:MAG: amino acid-binding protein [Candidatus Omnitrophica bacterium]|jgi:ACT domain-containing protein|nr:amino acid-binding protein [Candidatus Omnitrophota bacterium]
MKITQISVFLENKTGRLADVCKLLGNNQVNIKALTIAENKEFGILRLVVDKPKIALEVLRKEQFVAERTDIVAVEVDDRPGGLARLLDFMGKHDLNIEYMYGFMEKRSEKALMVFRFDDAQKAINALVKNGYGVVTEAALQ